MTIAEQLAHFTVGTRFEQLPDVLVDRTKQFILDGIGISIPAIDHPGVKSLLAFCEEVGGTPQATVVGRGNRLNVTQAALVNGYMVHLLEYDDAYMPPKSSILHGDSTVMPVVLGIGEWKGLPGRDVITAFAVGYEVQARLSRDLGGPMLQEGGWHVTGVVGMLGAAAAAGKLLRLDERTMTHALGIAATSACAIGEMAGTLCKAYHPGRAAMQGVMSAMLAQKGMEASSLALEAKRGFGWGFARRRELESVVAGLGESWETLNAGFKPHACGIVIHPTIDGVIALRNEHGLKAEDVESIEGKTNPYVLFATSRPDPQTGLEGKFSIEYGLAVALIDGAARLEQFTDARVRDPEVLRLRNRTTFDVDEAVRKDEGYVKITLKDGRVLETHVEHCIGSKDNPMGWQELEAKFRALSSPLLRASGSDRVVEMVRGLDRLDDTGKLVRATTP